jgi:hypothetical protein
MTSCDDFEVGQIWTCLDCGLEIKILKTCTACEDGDSCGCTDKTHDHEHEVHGCEFTCCNQPLVLKK